MEFLKNAQPIRSRPILDHYNSFQYKSVDLSIYTQAWKNWIFSNPSCVMKGLDYFNCADYISGTTQAFDHFILRHASKRTIATLTGEFQYHKCVTKPVAFETIHPEKLNLRPEHALILSLPFSGTGLPPSRLYDIFDICNRYKIPVLLDLAYWGISKEIPEINLIDHTAITDVVFSLSKPFFTLANHRVGIRFTRSYVDDGISMINETKMQNNYSMSLGVHFMEKFPANYIWQEFSGRYFEIVKKHDLIATNTIIFALSDQETYSEYNRGIAGLNRLCVSPLLNEV